MSGAPGGVLAYLRGGVPPQPNPRRPAAPRPRAACEVLRRAADAPRGAPWEPVGEYAVAADKVFARLGVGPGEMREGDLVRAQQGAHRVHGFVAEGLARRLPRVGDLPDLWPYVKEWALRYGDDWAEAWWDCDSPPTLAQIAGRAGVDAGRLTRAAVAVVGGWALGGADPDVGPAARTLLTATSTLLDLGARSSGAQRGAVLAAIEVARGALGVTPEAFERNMAAVAAAYAALEIPAEGGARAVPYLCEAFSGVVDAEARRGEGSALSVRRALAEHLRREWIPLRAVLAALRGIAA